MKGAFFQKPLEWQIDVLGEAWSQGDAIKGELRVKNLGDSSLSLDGAGVRLSYADIKKVHARDEKAFKQEAEVLFPAGSTIAAQESKTLAVQFTLPTNCPVTDTKASYYVTYGLTALESNLQVHVGPRKLFTEILKLMETFQRFKPKSIKASKGAVEFKLVPPTSREYAHVEALHLEQSLEGDQLKLDFTFKVKTLDTNSVTTKVAKDERHVSKVLTPREYSLGRDMINQDGILKALEEVLGQVKMKGL